MSQRISDKIRTAKNIPSVRGGQTLPSIRTAEDISSVTGGQKKIRIGEAKKIQDVAGHQAKQGDTIYDFSMDGKMTGSHPTSGGSRVSFGPHVEYKDLNSLKQFLAIVVGESGDDCNEATAIAQVMLRRLKLKRKSLSVGFVNKMGGTRQFNAIGHRIYNSVMKSSLDKIFNSNFSYATRIQGAMRALGGAIDLSGEAYFWNASLPENGSNWNKYENKIFLKTAAYGSTTFFKYNPNKEENPDNYKKTWP